MLDKNYIVTYKVFEGDTVIHQGDIPLPLVVGGRGGDSSLDGMWNPEWHLYETDYPGRHRRVEVYINGKTFIIRDDASFNKQ
jgi:hypothetical protein